ncbi:hypothetical protein DFH06DRAFT_261277 [Mycena polygramma]|nr:hypothetical protein DFH06DRAFT_261277 [Mycena polygramma]
MSICSNCGHNDALLERISLDLASGASVDSPGAVSSHPQLREKLDKAKSGILDRERSLAELRLAVMHQQTQLDILYLDRGDLETQLAVISYPVLALPAEITSRIFVACLPAHGRVRPSREAPPLLLTQVCRQWREIAISSCRLWASVDLWFSQRYGDPVPAAPLMLLEQWFIWAKGAPLSVTIRSPPQEAFSPLIPLLSSVARQISTLELDLDWESFKLLAETGMKFPSLQRLGIPRDDHRDDYHCLSFFRNSPSLSALTILNDTPDLTSDLYPSLTTIEVHGVLFETVLSILQRFPRLMHLSANLKVGGNTAPGQSTDPLVVPHLQSLALRRVDIRDVSRLTLPGLRRLDVHTDHYNTVFPVLLPLLARSSCALEHLGVPFWHGNEPGLVACLNAVPHLTSLTIDTDKDRSTYGLLHALSSSPLLPHLQTLSISAAYETFDYLAFVNLLQLRRNGVGPFAPPLQSVQLTLEQTEEHRGLEYLRMLNATEVDTKERIDHGDWLLRSVRVECAKLIAQGLRLMVGVGMSGSEFFWPGDIDDFDFCKTFP